MSTEEQEIAAFEAQMARDDKERTIRVVSVLTLLVLLVLAGVYGLAITMNVIASIFGV